MPLLSAKDRRTVEAIAGIGFCNPFLPERVELERKVLGSGFTDYPRVVHFRPGLTQEEGWPNVAEIGDRGATLAEKMRSHLIAGKATGEADLQLYEDLVLYILYRRYMSNFDGVIAQWMQRAEAGEPIKFWKEFLREFKYFFELPNQSLPSNYNPVVVFAGYFQIQRAFVHIFDYIIGGSMAMAHLRAAVWQSVFTHDMRRYSRSLYRHMGDIPTLVTGPSGTGKELVVEAIGRSRYIEFNPESLQFVADYRETFHTRNLSALAPTLIESELFGHKKGAFTGAIEDKPGWLEKFTPYGTAFLDEIGDLDPSIQVKLLRVLQSREFFRVGESGRARYFRGKLVAATNRDLAEEMRKGRFREDFYFRLCADIITTPSLRDQLAETPADLLNLVLFITRRILPDCIDEADPLADEVVEWIEQNLGLDYAWPGNIRELEQCVRNIMIRKSYQPTRPNAREAVAGARRALAEAVTMGSLTADELVRHYHTLIYAETGCLEAAAERLQVNWRTVKAKVDPDLLERYRAE